MRNFLFLTSLLVIVMGCTEKVEEKPLNIILIYVDDMGLGDASFTAGEVRPTPNIDRMAKEGKVFTQYYTNAPVCSPSRVAITTGQYPQRWNINDFLSSKGHNDICDQRGFLMLSAPSMARAFQMAGFKTAHIGKWHIGGGRNIEAPSIAEYGFDEYVSTWESPNPDPLLTSSNWIWARTDSIKRWERTTYFVDKTLDFLKRHKARSCFVNLWPDDVHSPWVASQDAPQEDKRKHYTLKNLKPVIDLFDQDMGRLLKGLEELDLTENTLIVFTSDNGPDPTFGKLRSNYLRGGKRSLYEGGINMPFIAYWPSTIKAGQVDSTTVFSAKDLFPTLCEIGGVQNYADLKLDGVDLSNIFLSEKPRASNPDIIWEYGRFNPRFMNHVEPQDKSLPLAIRSGDWKGFTSFDGSVVELYDLKKDPFETNNIAELHPELVESFKTKMLDWFEKTDKSGIQKEAQSTD